MAHMACRQVWRLSSGGAGAAAQAADDGKTGLALCLRRRSGASHVSLLMPSSNHYFRVAPGPLRGAVTLMLKELSLSHGLEEDRLYSIAVMPLGG